ncbi:MAG TPA: MFS transporter [Gemmatimonadales bacterium]|nr:MFS transporter [Gemmatimonadales bacterium]
MQMFGALRHRNFRLFIFGQFVSLCGTWMNTVALGWLVLELTNSPFQVGLVTTLTAVPVLALTLYGGVVADRVDRHRLVTRLQSLMFATALVLATLTVTHTITIGWVMALALVSGTLSAFEIPARQSFFVDMVGKEDLFTAIAMNSSVFNVSRILGPVFAGLVLAAAGAAMCFFADAASYLAVITSLLMMRFPAGAAPPAQPPRPAAGELLEGLRYMRDTPLPRMLATLSMTFSVFGFSFVAMLPVFARDTLHTGSAGYGALMSAVGVGAGSGAIVAAAFGHRLDRARLVVPAGVAFALSLALTALAPTLPWALAGLVFTGCAWVFNAIFTNTLLQTHAPDRLRGRVMGFYSFIAVGLAPLGALEMGWVSERWGVRAAYGSAGLICLVAGAIALRGARIGERASQSAPALIGQ